MKWKTLLSDWTNWVYCLTAVLTWLHAVSGHRESLARSRPVTQAAVTIAAVLISHRWNLLPVRSEAVRQRSGLASFGHGLWPRCLLCFTTHACCTELQTDRPAHTGVTAGWGKGAWRGTRETNAMKLRIQTDLTVDASSAALCGGSVHTWLSCSALLGSARLGSAPRSHHYLLCLLEKLTFYWAQCSLYIRPP